MIISCYSEKVEMVSFQHVLDEFATVAQNENFMPIFLRKSNLATHT